MLSSKILDNSCSIFFGGDNSINDEKFSRLIFLRIFKVMMFKFINFVFSSFLQSGQRIPPWLGEKTCEFLLISFSQLTHSRNTSLNPDNVNS